MGEASHVAAILLLFGAATADAQVAPLPPATGVYQKMSAGDQKVARALFEAQTTTMSAPTKAGSKAPSATPSAATANGPKPLTLDQIAALKQQGAGWESVFRQMHAQGLLAEKSIGQVVARHHQSRPPSASVVTTKADGGSYGRSGNLR